MYEEEKRIMKKGIKRKQNNKWESINNLPLHILVFADLPLHILVFADLIIANLFNENQFEQIFENEKFINEKRD